MRKIDPTTLKNHPLAHLIPEMRGNEWRDFYADVALRGIKVPLEILADGTIVDGRHRLRAALELGLREVPIVDASLSGDSPEVYMLKAAVLRRHLTDDQRAAMAALWVAENKKEPQVLPPGPGRGHKTEKPPPLRSGGGLSDEHPTQTEAMNLFKVGRRKVDRAAKVRHADPDLFEKVRQGDVKLSAAHRQVKLADDHQKIEGLTKLDGEYGVLVIDPPWPYNSRNTDPTHRAANPYPSMSIEELRQLTIPAAPDSIMWLWTTNAFLHEAFHLLEAWGFEYKTMLTWVKSQMGLGDWLRGKTEHCLLAVRGGYRIAPGNHTTVLLTPGGRHSEKPAEFYTLVEDLCPGSKIDIFARCDRDGWDLWGSDV